MLFRSIGQSAAQDDAKRRPGDEIVRVTAGHGRAWRLQQAEQIPPAAAYAGDIGEAVPAELQAAEVKRDGRKAQRCEIDRSGAVRKQPGTQFPFPLEVSASLGGGAATT